MNVLKILGCGSALPVGTRLPSAQLLEDNGRYFLIDCGEGTQLKIRENKISFNRITHIFISHLHGDHYFGLPGLLSTFQLLGRTAELHLFGPKELMDILNLQFKLSKTYLNYPLIFKAVEGTEKTLIWEDKFINVYSLPLNHRIQCSGYFFQELKKPNHLRIDMLEDYNIPHYLRGKIKEGADFTTENGEVIPHNKLTKPSENPISFAYCSDNRVSSKDLFNLKGVDYLYHETTFLHQDVDKAIKTFHSTAKEVAELAKKLAVKKLVIGHYSARYGNLKDFQIECQKEFENVIIGKEGLELRFEE